MENSNLECVVDPSPQGWVYGFPKAVPDGVWYMDGKHPRFKEDIFNVNDWMVAQGYPEKLLEHNILRKWVQEKKPEYYYPGSDPQE